MKISHRFLSAMIALAVVVLTASGLRAGEQSAEVPIAIIPGPDTLSATAPLNTGAVEMPVLFQGPITHALKGNVTMNDTGNTVRVGDKVGDFIVTKVTISVG